MFERACRYRRGILIKLSLLAIAAPLLLYAFSDLPPVQHTGGFGEGNCTECHIGNVNPAGGSVTIGNVPATYTPGAVVPLTVTISDTTGGRRLWGFQLSARFRNGQQAGSFAAGGFIGVLSAAGVQYAEHHPAQSLSGSGFTYTVNWTAPADASGGDVVFDAAGNAANGDGTNSGDHIFLTEAVSAAPQASAPSIFSGGIVSSATFQKAPNNAGAPGAIVAIFGVNLAVKDGHAPSVPLPFDINGTKVFFNGVAAGLLHVTPGSTLSQINVQVPFSNQVSPGTTANVVVEVNGVSSSAEPFKIDPVAPGIFTLPQSGVGPGVIVHSDNITVVTSSAPAKVGEIVVIYCMGLGQTEAPALETAKGGSSQRTLETPTLTIGGKDAPVLFSGAVQGLVGLYQINAVVPDVPAGDPPVVITMPTSNRTSPAGVTISVTP